MTHDKETLWMAEMGCYLSALVSLCCSCLLGYVGLCIGFLPILFTLLSLLLLCGALCFCKTRFRLRKRHRRKG